MTQRNPAAQLRAALRHETIVAPFVFDGLQAKLAEAAGLHAVYMTGFGTAAAHGMPDLGLLTMTEMVQAVRRIAGSTSLAVVCDADTGYGNAINVQRTVREYEAAGAAGLHIEDQVWPKRCGFFAGKEVIPTDEMVSKIRAACDARRDPDTVIIARTDALQPHGWDEAESRGRRYREAGADLVFVDGIRTNADLDEYTRRLGDLPLVYNGIRGRPAELRARGILLVLHGATLAVAVRAMRDAMRQVAAGEEVTIPGGPEVLGELMSLLGVQDLLDRAARYAATSSAAPEST